MFRNNIIKQVTRLSKSAAEIQAKRLVTATASKAEPFLNGTSANYVEDMYYNWLEDPTSVHASWRTYFKQVNAGKPPGSAYQAPPDLASSLLHPDTLPANTLNISIPAGGSALAAPVSGGDQLEYANKKSAVQRLVRSYQVRGHHLANLDPLGILDADLDSSTPDEIIAAEAYFKPSDMDEVFDVSKMKTRIHGDGNPNMKLRDIIQRLRESYCGSIAIEYMHNGVTEQCDFIRERLEVPNLSLSSEEKYITYKRLVQAQKFEEFLAKKWSSEKRFGLEGVESMIPACKAIIDVASDSGVESVVIGMPHRGRLNVLANVVRKDMSQIFSQFNSELEMTDEDLATGQSGDVKYHLGISHERHNYKTKKPINVSVVANPSHLEAVDPIVEGKVRAEQFYRNDTEGDKVMSVLLHGDAAFSGQGVVYETFHLSDLPQYTTHGTVHIVANNQIGFTTDPRFSRSSAYCTDVAKVVGAPIIHVNSDDPDAVIIAAKVCSEFRQKFKKDIVLDIVGYRRHGHNEIDNPMFTQPLMYQSIAKLEPILELYGDRLIKEGILTKQQTESAIAEYENICENGFIASKTHQKISYHHWLDSPWKGFFEDDLGTARKEFPSTGISESRLVHLGNEVSTTPDGFTVHGGLKRVLKGRLKNMKDRTVDWALGEAMAYGSLLTEGIHVRLSGQDVERGTFSHRHAVLHDQNVDGRTHCPLNHLDENQAEFSICNSSLSEYGVLGFELGYSMVSPDQLILWEAQFGDFSNTAQPIIDQFISSGEQKWVRQSGLVMLLPHGYEGMGPEHSSARLERFLQMTNDDPDTIPEKIHDSDFITSQLQDANWIIANVTTPANLFHILRRQIKMPFRKPLIIMSPKSLLRHPEARSSFDDMIEGTDFKRIITDNETTEPEMVRKIMFCSGKVFIDLKEERKKRGFTANDVSIVRIEQLSPFPSDLVKKQLDKFPFAKVYWCQEEHKNGGAFEYAKQRIRSVSGWNRRVNYAGRPSAAAAATGSKQHHKYEHKNFMDGAFKEMEPVN